MALTQVSTGGVKDGTILNADINASAAIAGTKISPSFSSNIAINTSFPSLFLTDTEHNSDFSIQNQDGTFAVKDETNSTTRLTIASSGATTFTGNCDFSAGIDVTGNITSTGDYIITNASPSITFLDSDANSDFKINVNGGLFSIKDNTNVDASRFVIDSSGNVGIGTTSPLTDAQLTISAADTPGLAFQRSGSGKFETAIQISSGHFFFKAGADSSTIAGLSDVMKIESTGNVGIGTAAPQVLLDAGGASSNGLAGLTNPTFYTGYTNTGGMGGIVAGAGANGNSPFIAASKDGNGNALSLFFQTNGTIRQTIDTSGLTTFSNDIRVDRGIAGSDGLLGQAYSGYFGLKHADQTLNSEYMIISNDTNTYISCSSGSSIYLRPSANSPTHETVFAHDITTYKTDIMMNGHVLGRSQHQWGHLQGGFNNIGASQSKTNPIFTIGSNYNPAESTLNDMYGIGFSHGNASFTPPTAGWGMYACADGDARIFLDATHARIYLDSNLSNTNTDAMYLAPTTGNYGSIQINGGTTGGWLGYSIAATAVFMSNGDIAGLYNDIENEWYAYGNRNGQWRTFYNGLQRTNTSNTGLTVTGTVNETSDIALKENIQPLTNALENLKKLKGYSYNFIDNKAKALGIVAQDVEKVYPDIVEGEEGEKSVAYSGLIAVLIEAIKELETEVAALKAS